MVVLRHEAWRFHDDQSISLVIAGHNREVAPANPVGSTQCLYLIYAATTEAAMQQHHERQGWSSFVPMQGITDRPYPAEWLSQQLSDYPDDIELRLRNSGVA